MHFVRFYEIGTARMKFWTKRQCSIILLPFEITPRVSYTLCFICLTSFKKITFLGPVTSSLTVMHFFFPNATDYIDPFGIWSFVKFFVAQTSRSSFFLQLLKS